MNQKPLFGIGLKLLSVVVFVVMMAMVKSLEGRIPPGQVVFFRSAFAVPMIVGWLAYTGTLTSGLKVKSAMDHVWRGLIGTVGMGLNFTAVSFLALPDATAIGFLAPVLVVILSAMLLDEKVRLFRLLCVGLGLIGVMIVLMPHFSLSANSTQVERLGALLGVMAASFVALTQVYVRKLVKTESMSAIVFYFSISSALVSLITLPFGWVIPSGRELVVLIACGLVGGLGQILMTSSFRFADVSLLAPFDYASMVFSLLIGYFIFHEETTSWTYLGGSVIALAGVLIVWREKRLGIHQSLAGRLDGQ